MTPRERFLATIVLALLLLGGGAAGGYFLVLSPLQKKKQAATTLQKEVDDLDMKLLTMKKSAPQVAAVKRASFPPDPSDSKDPNRVPTFNLAIAEYKRLLQHLLTQAGIKDGRPLNEKVNTSGRSPATPEMAPKKPAYTTLTFQIEINKANLWQVVDFLYGYYQVDLLHQITDIKVTRENKVTESRDGLKVVITSEAIALDGVEPRPNLVPVPNAFAAAAGVPALQAVSARPETALKLTRSGALASRSRDYSFVALHDMFYGVVPPYVPPPVRPFTLAKFEDVTLKRDDKPYEVKVKLSGDGTAGAKVSATATGSLLPEGSLEVDPKSGTIMIPAATAEMSEGATSKVEVVAVAADGKTTKKETFTVSVEKSNRPVLLIDHFIRLVIVSTASDGSGEAIIRDGFGPFRYRVSATAKGIEVTKEWPVTGKSWKRDRDYDHPPGVLMISDEETATRRTFKVVAVEPDALIVCEIGQPDPAQVEAKQGKGPGRGMRPPGGVPAKQGPADPVSAVAGAVTAAIPQPAYYRWANGKSLKELLDPDPKKSCKLKPDEVREILRRVASDGPVGGPALASGNE
jgi:hypothetical protein